MLAPAVLFATLLLWTASIGAAPVPSSLPAGRVLDHADLNGDGSQELIVALPDSCDEEGSCLVAVYQPEGSGYRVVLPPSVLWDLTPSSVAPTDADGWADLVEARREGPAPDDVTTVLWRYDGRQYRRVESTRRRLPSTPDWVSRTAGPGCPTTTIG